jgi:hypothetical protein
MDPLQFAALSHYLYNPEAFSALPNAPTVPDVPIRWARARAATAGILRRVADAVAPEPTYARPTLVTAHK